ncbi:fimbrial protein TcfA [Burkholderia diffusa]|uniref:fimbrial protein TcfA n=1 Tax=Burkholderia diffusa TaxID=488732 RepID=UPI0009BCD634|nr:fimbrial protein TcfA [Burkholderia diffusa]
MKIILTLKMARDVVSQHGLCRRRAAEKHAVARRSGFPIFDHRVLCALLASSSLVTAANAFANMTVYPMSLAIDTAKAQTAQIRVYSKSDEVQYVKVSVKKVIEPATDREHELPVGVADGGGLVVSPQKFVLSGGASHVVRLISLARPQEETLYRVYFEPVTTLDDGADDTRAVKGDVSVNLVWGVLVRVLPVVARPRIEVVTPTSIENRGNVRIGVLDIGRCQQAPTPVSCVWHAVDSSVYPGQSLSVPDDVVPHPRSLLRVKYQVDSVKGIQTQEFPFN